MQINVLNHSKKKIVFLKNVRSTDRTILYAIWKNAFRVTPTKDGVPKSYFGGLRGKRVNPFEVWIPL